MNFIQKFQNRAAYDAAEHDYPNISLLADTGQLIYTPEGAPQHDLNKVMVAYTMGSTGEDVVLLNAATSESMTAITSVEVNGVEVNPIVAVMENASVEGDYLVEYGIDTSVTSISDAFAADMGNEYVGDIEFLLPAWVESIDAMPNNWVAKMVVLADTAPYLAGEQSDLTVGIVYVPDEAVDQYAMDETWGNLDIRPLSQYRGLLPVGLGCFTTETTEQMLTNMNNITSAIGEMITPDMGGRFSFYILKDDAATMFDGFQSFDSFYNMVRFYLDSDGFEANCEWQGLYTNSTEEGASATIYQIGVDNQGTPDDYIEVTVENGEVVSVDTTHMASDRYDFQVFFY